MKKENDNENLDEVEVFDINLNPKSRNKLYIINPFKGLFRRIKADEERKQRSVLFGLLALLFVGICIGLCYPCVLFGVKIIKWAFTHNLGVFTYLFGIGNLLIAVLGFGVTLLPYYFWLQGITLVVMQLRLNRRLISWLALIVWLASVVLIFMLSIDSFAHIMGIGTAWFFK